MHSYSTRHANMNKENGTAAKLEEPTIRITRGRAKSLAASGGLPPPGPSRKHDQKPTLQRNFKRAASDENKPSISLTSYLQHKKRAVLKDVTNNPLVNCINAAKFQFSKQANKGIGKKTAKVAPAIVLENSRVQEGAEAKVTEEISIVETKESHQSILPVGLTENGQTNSIRDVGEASMIIAKQTSRGKSCEKLEASSSPLITDVDSNHKDPLMCSLYAPDIYSKLRVMEVSEEYRLVPDTLYLTVNIVDRFLSQNHIEKQRLQLLGVTCMLIASKYEEICAPSVEELCFITDNTYKREEVPCVELEFLANYLAELSLVEYGFLKFLPSLIAASAVFLAQWTLNQSDHPWNPTLEYYTSYVTSDLKGSVLALQELQLNTNGCSLNAIREKYRQQKCSEVARTKAIYCTRDGEMLVSSNCQSPSGTNLRAILTSVLESEV
ncbi:hypothetical protein Vadar_001909 [Vaccinium darrowii]|uniref:Uncharacterized protein n=1 Tax=Vaccinium darrowii TaxID=229202 RepID=A0ACB7XEW0_9ERIC|nr:hypothetical protein Vadar_001909 [Vaccinium darrowii]